MFCQTSVGLLIVLLDERPRFYGGDTSLGMPNNFDDDLVGPADIREIITLNVIIARIS